MGEARRRGSRQRRIEQLWNAHGVTPISWERYNAFVAWTRSPIVDVVGEELEFFTNAAETMIGVVLQDRTDRDFAFVVLGREEKGRFRAVDVQASLSLTEARHGMFREMKRLTETGHTVFPQGDANTDSAGVDLFATNVKEDRQHPSYKLLRDHEFFLPARSIMAEMMRNFVDVDGNFVEQFQTTAFDSRIWELYLYAALLEIGLFVEKPQPAPDFEVSRGRQRVFVEAVTIGPSPKDTPLPTDENGLPQLRTPEEICELLKTRVPIRFGSALFSKLNRENPYWEMENVKGHPLVLAIADFHESQSMTWTSPALLEYLYGVTHDFVFDEQGHLIITPLKIEVHEFEGKRIPSGYFMQQNAEHVSAVLFSSSGTISKFNRMGRLAGFGANRQRMYRVGMRHNHDPNASLPIPFGHEVTPGKVTETWSEGLSMFHNPRAIRPVDPDLFPGIAHHFFKDGQIRSWLPEFHPYTSFTWNLLLTESPPT